MEFISIFIVLSFLIGMIGTFITFDQILKIQYQKYKNAWEADGKPYGFFWKTKESKWLQGSIARNRLAFIWLFKTPDWIKNNENLKKYLFRLRLFVLILNLGIITLLIILSINTKIL